VFHWTALVNYAVDGKIAIVQKNFNSQHQIETLKFGRIQHVIFIA